MKIVVFGPQKRVGALVGDNVVDLNKADGSLPADLLGFIEAGQGAIDKAQKASERGSGSPDGQVVLKASDVKIHAPWPGKRIAMAGGNFAEHLRGMEADPNITLDEIATKARDRGQWGFWKVPAEVAGPEDEVSYPSRSEYFDYEGEPAIIIGKRGKDIKAGDVRGYVWGVTLVNDWSIRDGGTSNQRPMSYNLAKNFDMSTSIGPCIVVGELEHDDVPVQTKINGGVRQSFNSEEMIWGFGELLEYLSQDFSFVPGDIVSGGTNAGTAADKSPRGADGKKSKDLFLKKGDVVEVSSPKIGVLRNKVV